MSDQESPRAVRLTRPRWRDTRLILGLLLVALAVLLGSRALAAADRTVPVWAATRDLAAGSTLRAEDVQARQVRLAEAAARYLTAAADAPAGYVLTRPVGAGELLPAAAVTGPDAGPPVRLVTVPVERFHYPAGLERGARVDVFVTPSLPGGAAATPSQVLAEALVDGVERDGGRLGPSGSSVGVVLAVAPGDVAALVGALQQGAVDLVRVPGSG